MRIKIHIMGSHPINLIMRFLLELAAMFAVGYWAWYYFNSPMNYMLAIVIPGLLMTLWVVFAVPNDPSRSGKAPVPVPGIVRLLYEMIFFAFAVWALNETGFTHLSIIFGSITALHYIISYDRIIWLFSSKKQNITTET